MKISPAYKDRPALKRVVVLLPESQIEQVDNWGGPAGMRSRTDAIRNLLDRALRDDRQCVSTEVSGTEDAA